MPLQVCVHAVGRVCVLRSLGKPFPRIFTEPQGPRQSWHELWKLENFLFFGVSIFPEVGHPLICGGRSAMRASGKSHKWTQ